MATNAVTDPASTSVWHDDRADPAVLALARPGARHRRRDGARDRDRLALRRPGGARHGQDAQRAHRCSARHLRLLHRRRPAPARDQAPRAVPPRAGRRRPRALEPPPRRRRRASGSLSFYVTYLSYRNLKGFLPFLTDQDFDPELLSLDRSIFLGHDPGPLLHSLLGTGIAAHLLSIGLPLLPRLRADLARRRADRVVEPDPRALVRHRARPQLDAGRRLLPDAPVARPGLRRARPLLDAAGDRHVRAAAGADLRAPRGAGRAGGPEHRRVRVAARLRRLHRGADRPAAAAQPRPARARCGRSSA